MAVTLFDRIQCLLLDELHHARARPFGSRAAELGPASQGKRQFSSGELTLSKSRLAYRATHARQAKACDSFTIAHALRATRAPSRRVYGLFWLGMVSSGTGPSLAAVNEPSAGKARC